MLLSVCLALTFAQDFPEFRTDFLCLVCNVSVCVCVRLCSCVFCHLKQQGAGPFKKTETLNFVISNQNSQINLLAEYGLEFMFR